MILPTIPYTLLHFFLTFFAVEFSSFHFLNFIHAFIFCFCLLFAFGVVIAAVGCGFFIPSLGSRSFVFIARQKLPAQPANVALRGSAPAAF